MALRGHVVHHIPGRLRIKFEQARGNAALLAKLREVIAPLSGVRQVRVNPVTGSVLIFYRSEMLHFGRALAERGDSTGVFSLARHHLRPTWRRLEIEAEKVSHFGRATIDFVNGLDRTIKLATDNQLDLRVLLPMMVGGYGVASARRPAPTPMWLTMMIASLNWFIALARTEAGLEPGEAPPEPGET